MDWNLTNIASACGGGLIFIYLLWQVIEKAFGNIGWLKKRKEEKIKKEKEKLKREFKEFIDDFLPPVINKFENHVEDQSKKMDLLINSSNDLLRHQIVKLYYKYLPYKKILLFDKKTLIQLYTDYAGQGGNSYIKEIYEEMLTWEVVFTEAELGTL